MKMNLSIDVELSDLEGMEIPADRAEQVELELIQQFRSRLAEAGYFWFPETKPDATKQLQGILMSVLNQLSPKHAR